MTQFFQKLGQTIHDHAKLCLTLVALITIGFAFGLGKIQLNTGNDMFVSSNSKLAKDSKTYQKNFGNDVFVVNVSTDNGKKVISSETFKKVAAFSKEANQVEGIKTTTSVVNMLNAELHSKNAASLGNSSNSTQLQTEIMSELSNKQQQNLQSKATALLQKEQQQKIAQYTQSILTDQQKMQLAQAQQQSSSVTAQAEQSQALSKLLNQKQQKQVQNYTMSLLTKQQQGQLAQTTLSMLPSVQNMDTKVLHSMIFSANGKIPNQLEQLLPQNGKHLLISLTTAANSDMNMNQAQVKKLNHLLRKHGLQKQGYNAKLAGAPAIAGTVKAQMTKSMMIMLVASVIIMIIILLIVFPVRRRLLPLFVVLIAMVWTFGFMGWLGVNLTMATMAILPILIGLGTDFGVQFINRYEEEFRKNNYDSAQAVVKTSAHSGSAVATATFVMILSFLTMRISKAPMLKDFGLTLAIGVFICYIVEAVTIFAYLSLRDAKVDGSTFKEKDLGSSWLNRKLGSLSGWIMKHAGIVLTIGLILGGVGFFFEHQVKLETNMFKMIPQDLPALQQNKKLEKLVGSTTNLTYLVHSDDVRSKDTLKEMNTFANKEKSKHSSKILDTTSVVNTLPKNQLAGSQKSLTQSIDDMPQVMKSTLVSSNHKYATISFKLNANLNTEESLKLMNSISKDAKQSSNSIRMSPAGTQAMLYEGIHNLSANRSLTMIAGLIIIFVVLLVIYRHWHYAIYPLLPIAIVLGLSPLTLKLLGISYNPVTISLSSLVLGIGTEFTILVLERYIEERQHGQNNENAITTSLSSVGQAITSSGLTVVAGFSTLLFVSFPVLKDFGLITVLDTAYALISTLTILPAIIYLLKPHSKNK
ncbi:MMPL family transporter [Ligilactobacillus pobuzihii]|uniref:efflux RND transporter permease subunit n=1 Tax=Ligilactobacillus pobuzihii TaxID=449659 RepID=UPI0019D188B7|nr:hydrophobe/amphiphile efflux-3 (HAE3) family transporter [Ligilactobacillus pobuzihii]MBN7274352.1 MMPL family transporter [Ligilactobacillus pobuzihii]